MESFEKWIIKAETDLKSAKKLFEGGNQILDTSIYHTQQCAEKALKTYLDFKLQPIEQTHDLNKLLLSCKDLDADFEKLKSRALILTSYSTEFRYPGDDLEPSGEEVANAIEYAEFILTFVKNKILKK